MTEEIKTLSRAEQLKKRLIEREGVDPIYLNLLISVFFQTWQYNIDNKGDKPDIPYHDCLVGVVNKIYNDMGNVLIRDFCVETFKEMQGIDSNGDTIN